MRKFINEDENTQAQAQPEAKPEVEAAPEEKAETKPAAAAPEKTGPQNYVDAEDFAKMLEGFGGTLIEGDDLGQALDRIYVANEDQIQDLKDAAEEYQEEIDKKTAKLKDQVDNGEITEAQMKSILRKFRPSVKIPAGQVVNLLVMGDPGGGKTSIIEQWGINKGVKIVKKTAADITASVGRGLPAIDDVIDPEGKIDPETGKVRYVKEQAYLPSTFFNALDDEDYEYTVLFVDEINRNNKDAESAILTLVCDHTISNRNYKSGRQQFKQYLFTVAACNPPANSPETRKLSLAMSTRFELFIWNNNPENLRNFLNDQLDNKIIIAERKLKKDPNGPKAESRMRRLNWNKGRKEIINTIVDAGLQFSDSDWNNEVGDPENVEHPEDIHVINARTLMTALYACDGTIGFDPGMKANRNAGLGESPYNFNYTAGSFMDKFKKNCTGREEQLLTLEVVLSELADDMASRANDFQKTLLDKYIRWRNKNGAKYGMDV